MLLLFSSLLAKPVTITPKYCTGDQVNLGAHFFVKRKNPDFSNFDVISLPKTRAKFSVPVLKIASVFQEHNISVIDETGGGVVEFQRYCDMGVMGKQIALELMRVYEAHYPCIEFAKEPYIEPISTLPYDFGTYEFNEIDIQKSFLRKEKGSFRVGFSTQTHEKKLTFRYEIDAYVTAFKAKHNLDNDKILSKNDYTAERVKIDRLPSRIITCQEPRNLMTKSYVQRDSFLRSNRLEIKKDVLKGRTLRALIRDGMLVIDINAEALEDGDVGEVISIRAENGKRFKAKLIGGSKALILQ